MPTYNFKTITVVPNAKNIHPFYADLINVLYSKDHYKLALGQVNTAKNIIDGIGRDQVKMLKYGESLYQCKTLKRTAFGRMCTVIKRQANNLKFLEDTRQHLSRLPSIDPDARTLILCGFPNVGKSSFINKITRADVDVQPFPFTTKSLFVGHTDYNNLRWQVIDTPGLLDRPLEEHNTIEMISITALAHLQAAVVYIMDLSEQCGYTVEQQISLFNNLKPLYRNKPLFVVSNKADVRSFEESSDEVKTALKQVVRFPDEQLTAEEMDSSEIKPVFLEMSTVMETGVVDIRNKACDELLALRVQSKLNALKASDKDDNSLSNRLLVVTPEEVETREPFIPPSVITKRKQKAEREKMLYDDGASEYMDDSAPMHDGQYRTLREKELAEGDDYETDLRIHWDLKNAEEKYDIIPEIFNGHNIVDFFDPDIEERLNELENQEKEFETNGYYDGSDWLKDEYANDPKMAEIRTTASKIREARALRIMESKMAKRPGKRVVPRSKVSQSVEGMRKTLGDYGLPVDMTEEADRGRSKHREIIARNQSKDRFHMAAVERAGRSRSRSGLRDESMAKRGVQESQTIKRRLSSQSRKGEGDRTVPCLKPKHLFTGKRGTGKTDRR